MSSFLAVLLSVILLFQSTFYSLTGYAGAQAMLQRMLDLSAYSVLADYDGRVKNRYGLYMLYQDGTSLQYQISDYLTENMGYEADMGLLDIRLQNMDTAEQGFSYLSRLEKQILDYCRYRVPAATIEEFLERADSLLQFLQKNDIDTNFADEFPSEGVDIETIYDWDAYQVYDMRKLVEENMDDILNAAEETVEISDSVYSALPSQTLVGNGGWDIEKVLDTFRHINFEDASAKEHLKECIDDLQFDGIGSALYEDYVINEYILSVFNHMADFNREDFYMKWEVEYILFGMQSDADNADYTELLILLIRFILNSIYLYGEEDMVKTAEVASYLATVLAGFKGQPEVKNAILLAWSLMESWNDYKLMAEGEQVPVYKQDGTWKYWVSYDKDAAEENISLYYKDYLRIFLLMIPREVRLARILDLIQLNESQSNSTFQVLSSVTQFQIKIICCYDNKKRWSLEAAGSYGY